MDIITHEMDIITKLKNLNCYKEGEFTLKSGKKSNYYIDLRYLVSHPKILKQICGLINNKLEGYQGLICGLPYAGIPYSHCISVLYDIPCVLLRKEKKKYGMGKMIEGEYKNGDELIIIDDILTTGTSVIESLEHLQDFKIKKILVVVDRGEGGKEALDNLGYEVDSLFSIDDFRVNTSDKMMNIREKL